LDSSTKLYLDLYLAKFLDNSKLFFLCIIQVIFPDLTINDFFDFEVYKIPRF